MNTYQTIMLATVYLVMLFLAFRLWKWDSDAFPSILAVFVSVIITIFIIAVGLTHMYQYLGTL